MSIALPQSGSQSQPGSGLSSIPRSVLIPGVMAILTLSTLLTLYGFAQQQPFFVVIGVAAAPLALAMLRWPDAATLGAVAILYTNAADVAVTFYRVPYWMGAGFLALLIIPLAKHLIIDRKPLIVHPTLPLIAALLLVYLAGTIFARERGEAFRFFLLFLCEGFVLYVLFSNVVRTPKTLRAVTWVLVGCGAFMGSLSCIQQATGSYQNNYGGFAQVESKGFNVTTGHRQGRQFRLGGPLGEKNRYAQNMLMLVPLGVVLALTEKRARLRWLAGIATCLTVAGMTLAFSRGAAVGAMAVLLVTVVMRYINLRQTAMVAAGAAATLLVFPQYVTRLASLESLGAFTSNKVQVGGVMPDGALNSRTTAMLCAGQAFLDHPIIGVGPGMFPLHYQDYARWVGRDYEAVFRDPHNLYLGIAAEHGILGFICFVLIIFITLRNLHWARRVSLSRRPEMAYMATAYLLAIVSYLATGIGLHLAFFRFFWFMLAMAGAASYIARNEWAREHASLGCSKGQEDALGNAGTIVPGPGAAAELQPLGRNP